MTDTLRIYVISIIVIPLVMSFLIDAGTRESGGVIMYVLIVIATHLIVTKVQEEQGR
ncbi:hypothetical protein [Planococcus lenghuensis]|uniref:hypothetical protein n=1 Tax=Planococcus lenghuensis TaxID=2213202 RepID=UPI0012EB5745|nr:hypothetical protein [Planococcus lenghuensis]